MSGHPGTGIYLLKGLLICGECGHRVRVIPSHGCAGFPDNRGMSMTSDSANCPQVLLLNSVSRSWDDAEQAHRSGGPMSNMST
jgi:hypothetical protein